MAFRWCHSMALDFDKLPNYEEYKLPHLTIPRIWAKKLCRHLACWKLILHSSQQIWKWRTRSATAIHVDSGSPELTLTQPFLLSPQVTWQRFKWFDNFVALWDTSSCGSSLVWDLATLTPHESLGSVSSMQGNLSSASQRWNKGSTRNMPYSAWKLEVYFTTWLSFWTTVAVFCIFSSKQKCHGRTRLISLPYKNSKVPTASWIHMLAEVKRAWQHGRKKG